jgi:dTDP-4-amino-4,6-dideoxygalactose transaminase
MNLLQINSEAYGEDREALMQRLGINGIQSRPVWVLNYLQKPYSNCQTYNIKNAIELVEKSLCIPSSTNLTDIDIQQLLGHLGSRPKK